MKCLSKLLPLSLLILACVSCSSGKWEWIGKPASRGIFPYGDYATASLAIDYSDKLYVTWSGRNDDRVYQVFIKCWDGEKWVELGKNSGSKNGISNNKHGAGSSSIALGPNELPVIVWTNISKSEDNEKTSSRIYAKRWDGSKWIEIGEGSTSEGGILNKNGFSDSHSLALDSEGNPFLVWMDNSSKPFQIYTKRWNGKEWVEIGEGSASGKGISNSSTSVWAPIISLDSNDRPVVAWLNRREITGGSLDIFIRRWDGTSWVEIGEGSASDKGINKATNFDDSYDLILDSSGNPVLAWNSFLPNDEVIYIKKWNGKEWEFIGPGTNGKATISDEKSFKTGLSLAIDSKDMPVLSWIEISYPLQSLPNWAPDEIRFFNIHSNYAKYSVYVKRWDGTKWEDCGSQPIFSGNAYLRHGPLVSTSLVLDSKDNPIVLWNNGPEFAIKRFVPKH